MRRRDFVRGIVGVGAIAVLSSCATVPARSAPSTRLQRIGYLFGGASTANSEPYFRERLRDLGYVEGHDIVLESRTADNVNDRLPGLLSELIGLPADVLVTQESAATLAATRATTTIPIVFIRVQDPVAQGVVSSLAQPGGNVTGVTATALKGKQTELMKAIVPHLKRYAVLLNENSPAPGVGTVSRDLQDMARLFELELQPYGVHNSDELDIALESIVRSRPDALYVGPSFTLAREIGQIPDFAATLRLPTVYATDIPFVRAGGLMAVGSNFPSQARRGAELVDKILKGARPAELPVEQPTELDVILSLTAAQRIGLTIPDIVLRQVTEFVR